MRRLPDDLAIATGGSLRDDGVMVLRARRRGAIREVRLGVGGHGTRVPARVFGFARCVAETLRVALPTLAGPVTRIVVCSSRTKIAGLGGRALSDSQRDPLPALAMLVGALRLAEVGCEILVEEASPDREVPTSVSEAVVLSQELEQWLQSAETHNGGTASGRDYAIEHAAASMFADLPRADSEAPDLTVTIGPKPEARFFAVRRLVRRSAVEHGLRVANSLGLIFRSLGRPWYHPTASEPDARDLLTATAAEVVGRLEDAANPTRGGNAGLKREARAARHLLLHPEAVTLVRAAETPEAAADYLRDGGYNIGPRLEDTLRRLK